MTEQEAKEWLANDTSPMKIHIAELQGENPMEYINSAIEVAIKCMEKQIAKKPIDCDDREVWHLCPACKGDLTKIRSFYCGFCGQKLDWGNEDAE